MARQGGHQDAPSSTRIGVVEAITSASKPASVTVSIMGQPPMAGGWSRPCMRRSWSTSAGSARPARASCRPMTAAPSHRGSWCPPPRAEPLPHRLPGRPEPVRDLAPAHPPASRREHGPRSAAPHQPGDGPQRQQPIPDGQCVDRLHHDPHRAIGEGRRRVVGGRRRADHLSTIHDAASWAPPCRDHALRRAMLIPWQTSRSPPTTSSSTSGALTSFSPSRASSRCRSNTSPEWRPRLPRRTGSTTAEGGQQPARSGHGGTLP